LLFVQIGFSKGGIFSGPDRSNLHWLEQKKAVSFCTVFSLTKYSIAENSGGN
jgi:hypothetical protein